jgi:hypothetical protein
MTKKVTIEILDDTDGSPAEQTVPFGLDGIAYEIDLSTTNANALREALAPYVASARQTGGRRIKVAVGQPTDSTKQEPEPSTNYTATHDIRTWARENGYEVADQGRIAKTVIDAYRSSRRHLSTETNRKLQTETETAAKRRPKPRKLCSVSTEAPLNSHDPSEVAMVCQVRHTDAPNSGNQLQWRHVAASLPSHQLPR